MKYLVAGLGNIGPKYEHTRHNIGFDVLDALAGASNIFFTEGRHALVSELKFKGRTIVLIKPTTFMNLSGKAVNYWMQHYGVPVENLLVITDDLALPFGKIRIRPGGSDGGHNGLKDIIATFGHSDFARLRFGIGSDFAKGRQSEYVLGKWTPEEDKELQPRIELCAEIIKGFATAGLQRTMNDFNNR